MSSPFINRSGGSGIAKVVINGVSTDALGFISLPLSSLPDVEIVVESLATGELLSYDATSGKWSNVAQTPSTYPFSLFQALSQKGVASGYCGLDAGSLVSTSNIPSLALAKLSDFNVSTPSDKQVFQYDSNTGKWVNVTLSLALSSLSDCSISSPSNDQVLIFTTHSSLNKWTPYTISGATFDDANKTITVTAGSSALSSLTDVTITNVGDGNLLMYSSTASKWINIDAIPDNILFFKDESDGTKKLQFQLSSITTGQTRTLTVPDYSGTIAVSTNTQTNNYALVTNGTSPSWQQVNHTTLSNIGTNTHAQIDTHIAKFDFSNPSTGQLLCYNGTKWATLKLAGISSVFYPYDGGYYCLKMVFDGRFIYYISTNTSTCVFARYDTTKKFGIASSYETFDTSNVSVNTKGYYSGVFDGRFIYFAPIVGNTYFLRYDTTLSFTSASSYSYFDLSGLVSNSTDYGECVFDGTYVHLFRRNTAGGTMNMIWTRYDTTLSFTDVNSYSYYDVSGVIGTGTRSVYCACFDGRYVYAFDEAQSRLLRYDTTATFNTNGSYAYYSLVSLLSGNAISTYFDGKYIYCGDINSGKIVRYNPALSFTTAGSYQSFDTGTVGNGGYTTAFEFDGRFLYMLSIAGTVTAYDTSLSFTNASSHCNYIHK